MNSETTLLRQVHPSFIHNGKVSSQVFRPTPKDDSKLSVYDGDMIDAEKAYDHFISNPVCSSCGVMAVTVNECNEVELEAVPDPEPFPEHAIIDFSLFDKNQIEKKAKKLKIKAEARDWLYRPA